MHPVQGASGESCSSVASEGKRERPSDSPRSTSMQRRLRRRLLACDLMLARCSTAQASLACGLPCADDSTRALGERDSDEEMDFEVTGVLFEGPRNQQPAGSAGASASSGERDRQRCVAGAKVLVLAFPGQVSMRMWIKLAVKQRQVSNEVCSWQCVVARAQACPIRICLGSTHGSSNGAAGQQGQHKACLALRTPAQADDIPQPGARQQS